LFVPQNLCCKNCESRNFRRNREKRLGAGLETARLRKAPLGICCLFEGPSPKRITPERRRKVRADASHTRRVGLHVAPPRMGPLRRDALHPLDLRPDEEEGPGAPRGRLLQPQDNRVDELSPTAFTPYIFISFSVITDLNNRPEFVQVIRLSSGYQVILFCDLIDVDDLWYSR